MVRIHTEAFRLHHGSGRAHILDIPVNLRALNRREGFTQTRRCRLLSAQTFPALGHPPPHPLPVCNSSICKINHNISIIMGVSKRQPEEDDECFITDVQPAMSTEVQAKPAKRRRVSSHQDASIEQLDGQGGRPSKKKPAKTVDGGDGEVEGKPKEKRLRRWRKKAPQAWLQIRDRALTQRMFALDRTRDDSNPEHPTETISLAGTTGNVYTITIEKVPSCNCPHANKGNQCKHIAYVLSRVLRVKNPELEYQFAFTSSELKEVFEQAPPLPSKTADDSEKDGNRKPIEGECPICVVGFEPDSSEKIVYCKGSTGSNGCGNNIHAECFNMWKATKPAGGVTCPFCRTPWLEGPELGGVAAVGGDAKQNEEGYVNVAGQLGLSGRRDYSTYNSYWVRQQLRNSEIGLDDEGAMAHDYWG